MSWASELPGELLCRPTGLVVLTGLDLTYNAVHKAIWDAFCNNRRPERVPLQFRALGADHEYPKCRSKRSSYEWYIPKGILKTGWMKKHLELIPSVVVVFFDLDWDENLWKERQMECTTKVEIVRNSLQGRGTKVCVVLIQKNTPLPPGEDVVAAERAASLCSACELSSKSLFVLPLTDHLQGYVIRLENAYYELTQSYYHTEARKVKAHKEFLNKTTHQLLFVRHQFKIAFFNELKQDSHTALKHYKQAYAHALDLRMHDSNLLEVKTIAGFINYKICRLSFQHNAPLDAISQFRKHIDFFKTRVGIVDLAFEHSGWMSKQFQVFGDLFDEAIKLGLNALQTQHPGFYFQHAANHAVSRKELCKSLCLPDAVCPSPDPLEQLSSLDYYGQRPWRQGNQSIDPPDAGKEKDGVLALQCLEMKVDHSWITIPLLSAAVAQFKKYKSPRMKRYLMVQMGKEYYHAHDYAKALTLLSRVMWDYRQERWWMLLTSILRNALQCAYLTANIQEYVTLCLELIGTYADCPIEDKHRIQANLLRVMSNEAPEPEPDCSPGCVEKAAGMWHNSTSSPNPCIFTVEMQNIIPFVECKGCFIQPSINADEKVILRVFLRTSCPYPLRFAKLSVLLSNQVYNQHCVVTDPQDMESTDESNLYLVPGETKVHTFSFYAQPEDVGKLLEITSIALELGSQSTRSAILHWSGGGGDAVAPPLSQQGNLNSKMRHEAALVKPETPWDLVKVHAVARLQPRSPKMSVLMLHEPPALVNEYYKVKVTIRNEEESAISKVQLSMGLKEGQDAATEQSTHISLDVPEFEGKVICRRAAIDLGSLAQEQEVEKVMYMKSLRTGPRNLFAKVTYTVEVTAPEDDVPLTCTCHCEHEVTLDTLQPFDIRQRLVSIQYEKVESVHAEEPFLLLCDIRCTSPWTVAMETSELLLEKTVQHAAKEPLSQLRSVTLSEADGASECWCLVTPPGVISPPSTSMGKYVVHWKRQSSDDSIPYVTTVLDLPVVTVEHVPLFVDVDLPPHGNVRSNFRATYNIYNRTPFSQEIELNMEHSDAFMFAGHKTVNFRVLPNRKHQVTYNLVPLLPGNVLLPGVHIKMLRYGVSMEERLRKMLPTHIFVKPSGKEPSAGDIFLQQPIET